ncbi:MAG: hypothetical protein ABSF88_06160 [Candidatus Aminicenantales bacterium]
MPKKFRFQILAAVLFTFLFQAFIIPGFAQTPSQGAKQEAKPNAPKVFMKSSLDSAALRKDIAYVQYVEGEAEAQILVEITSQKTDHGEEFTIALTGRREFSGVDNLLRYTADPSQKPEDVQKGLINVLKMGLLRYVSKTPVADRVNIAFLDQVKPTSVIDQWDFWVFSFNVDTFIEAEASYKMQELDGSFSANRVTPEWKIRFSLSASHYKNCYSYSDSDGNSYSYESVSDSRYLNGLVVKSLDDHWSIGTTLAASSSTYTNIDLKMSLAPAIEYDLFPYSESTKKQLRFMYYLGLDSMKYRLETIYDKMKEILVKEGLSVTLELKQPWGTISSTLAGSHYFSDLKFNRIDLSTEISFRIIKGLNLNVYGSGSRIHDQLYLQKGELTKEEVLLQRRQLETTFNYYFSIGLSYTFGSTSSNVVNPRFGSSSTIRVTS